MKFLDAAAQAVWRKPCVVNKGIFDVCRVCLCSSLPKRSDENMAMSIGKAAAGETI
jgi:hypothetical protein